MSIECRCSLVSPGSADIDEGLADKAKLFRQTKREAEFGAGRIVVLAAERIRRDRIARADAAYSKATQIVATDEEEVCQPEGGAAIRQDHPSRAANGDHEIFEELMVVDSVYSRPAVQLRTGRSGPGQGVANQQATGGSLTLIARIPGNGLREFRDQRLASLRL